MRSRLAALVAAGVAAAVTVPEPGLVVHRHAGGDHLHVHAEHEHHHRPAPHHADEHDHQHHHPSSGPAASIAPAGWALHTHWTQPFQRIAPSKPPAVGRLRPVARLTLAAPHQRIAAPRVPDRSRGPPPLRSI